MSNIGTETKSKHCRKCSFCTEYDHYDVLANTHTPVFYCHFKKGIFKGDRFQKDPTFDEKCPCFWERLKEDKEEEDE